MEARPKLKPGQTGTKKLVELSGFRLVCLCYLRVASATSPFSAKSNKRAKKWNRQLQMWEILADQACEWPSGSNSKL